MNRSASLTLTAVVCLIVEGALVVGIATPAHAATDKQIRFMSDVDQHGGLSASQVYNGKITLGDAVCDDLHKGNAAPNEAIGVANDTDALHGSMSKLR